MRALQSIEESVKKKRHKNQNSNTGNITALTFPNPWAVMTVVSRNKLWSENIRDHKFWHLHSSWLVQIKTMNFLWRMSRFQVFAFLKRIQCLAFARAFRDWTGWICWIPEQKNGKHRKKEKSVNSTTPPVEIWYILVLKSATHIKHLISVNFTGSYQAR